MKKSVSLVALLIASQCLLAQGGQGGAAGGGFGAGSAGPTVDKTVEARISSVEFEIDDTLRSEPKKLIVTPGEYGEWILDLKANQVVIADASSSAFDPALEVTTPPPAKSPLKVTVLATNDDRYPGDQRPLLLWRCEKAGKYALRVRCFRDKSGGQVEVRMRVFDSFDFVNGVATIDPPKPVDTPAPRVVMLRLHMMKGQISQVYCESVRSGNEVSIGYAGHVLSSSGLPDPALGQRLNYGAGALADSTIIAPVDDDYYLVTNVEGSKQFRMIARQVTVDSDQALNDKESIRRSVVWRRSVKRADILLATLNTRERGIGLVIVEAPLFEKFNLQDADRNPFYPTNWESLRLGSSPPIVSLPSRDRDERVKVFSVESDSDLWFVASSPWEPDANFGIELRNALSDYAEGTTISSDLAIGKTDYWSFAGSAGDVVTFETSADGFSQEVRVLDPSLKWIGGSTLLPDEKSQGWTSVLASTGRFVTAVSAYGNGGGGAYTLKRTVVKPTFFDKSRLITGNFVNGRTEAWKFTVTPNSPVMLKYRSDSHRGFPSITTEDGLPVNIKFTEIGNGDRYALIDVDAPMTYLIVMSLIDEPFSYWISLHDLPGFNSG